VKEIIKNMKNLTVKAIHPVVKKLQTKTNPKKKSASISYMPYKTVLTVQR